MRDFTCACKLHARKEDDNGEFDLHAKDAGYPGGPQVLKKFLKDNIDKSLKGKHSVELRFNVDRNGDISGFTLLNNTPAQKYEEVVRVLKLSGKWFPAVHNGYCIQTVYRLQVEL